MVAKSLPFQLHVGWLHWRKQISWAFNTIHKIFYKKANKDFSLDSKMVYFLSIKKRKYFTAEKAIRFYFDLRCFSF